MSYHQAKALLNKGVSRPTLFAVQLPNRRISGDTNDYLKFFCQAASIPEVRANTIAVAGQENMGIVREQATGVMFGKPFSIQVIADKDFVVYKELRNWFNAIAENSNQEGGRSQRMNYYETIVEDMQLSKLEFNGPGRDYKSVLDVKFIRAYPIQISEVTLETSTIDTYTTFQVDFTYESYSLSDSDGVLAETSTDGFGILTDLINFF